MAALLAKPRFRMLLIVVAALLLLGASAWSFIGRALHDRDTARENIARMRALTRAQLAAMWHVKEIKPFQFKDKYVDRIDWTPSTTATLALAVTPRAAWSESDAIYTLYEGDKPLAIFAMTNTGVYFNDQAFDVRRHPETLVARPLTAGELADLGRILDLLRLRRDGYDPQSPGYRWTHQVIQAARDLYDAQARLAGKPASGG